jgi:hypothetical protein
MIRMIVITAAVALVAAVARWLAVRSRSRVFWEDRCAACGYIVQGLPGHVCPECGADLRRAGAVLPPGVVPGLSVDWIFVLWTVTAGVAYGIVNGAWLSDIPPVYLVTARGHYDRPISGNYDGFSANYEGEMYRGAPVSGRLEVILHLRGGDEARMVVDPVTWAYHTTAGPVQVAPLSEFGADALAGWLRAYGVDTSEPKARDALEGLAYTLRGWSVDRSSAPAGFWAESATSGAEARTTGAVKAARIGFALVWLIGAVWLVRRSWPTSAALPGVA